MSASRPRILYLSSSWPCGNSFGGQLRALHIGQALKQVGEVTLAVVSSEANDQKAQQLSAEEFTLLPPVLPQVQRNRGPMQKLRWALDPGYMNLHGQAASPADRARIVAALDQYDLVWVLNSRTANILQLWRWPHAHLDVDDVPSTYLRGVAQSEASASKRWRANLQRVLWKRRELRYGQRFSTLSVCSQEDKAYLGGSTAIHVIPNGFARPRQEPSRQLDPVRPRIGFIGLYSYAPNLEGVRWFLRECWPRIRQEIPGIRFRLAGKDTVGPLAPDDPDVDCLGWIDRSEDEIATWSAMIIPIPFGGGTRIKIADAFSRKCPVVSTSIGAFGYDVQSGRQLRLADSPAEFSSACVELVRNPAVGVRLAETAWADFLTKWTWEAIAPRVQAAAQDNLARSRSSRP